MSSDVGKKNIAYKGSNHGAAAPPAMSLLSPPVPPAPAPFPYVCRVATATNTLARYRIDSLDLLVEGSTMDIEAPANQPTQGTAGDILTHAVTKIGVMTMGSAIMSVSGKGVCGTGDIVAMNVLTAQMKFAQMQAPLLEGADFELASKSSAAAAAMNEKYWRAYHPNRAQQTTAGDPVDLGTGFVVDVAVDLALPGPIPLIWMRTYSSALFKVKTGLGKGGWRHGFEQWIEPREAGIRLHDEEGLPIDFPAPPLGGVSFNRGRRLEARATRVGYEIRSLADRLVRTFSPLPGGRLALRAIRDSYDHQITLDYEGNDLVRIRDTVGRELRIAHDAKARVTRVEVWARPPGSEDGPSLQTWFDYTYHPEGELASHRDAVGAGRDWQYDGLHRLIEVTLPNGVAFHYSYHGELGRCVRTWGDGGLHDVRIDIDFEKGETRTHGTNRARRYLWKKGIVTREETYGGDWSAERAYDEDELLVVEKNGNGDATTYEHDERGNLVKESDPAGNITSWEIHDDLPVRRIGPTGLTTCYEHDPRGALVGVVFSTGLSLRFERNPHGDVTVVHGADGVRARLDHDEHRNLIADMSGRGATTSYRYDAMGRPTEQSDALGRKSRVQYDAAGRVTEVVRADGTVVRATYDRLGKLASTTDALGRVIKLEHMGTGLLGRVTQADGQIFQFRYDADERLVQVLNPRLEKYELEYDRADRIVAERTFDDRLISYRYDCAGRVIRVDYPEGEWRELAYDKLGNVVEDRGADVQASFARDSLGRVEKAISQDLTGKVVTRIERDKFGRIVADIQNDHAVRYELDERGRRSARTLPDGERTRYRYDSEDAVIGVEHEGRSLAIERDALGRERVRWTNAWKLESDYDTMDRVLSQRVTAPEPGRGLPRALAERSYGYDAMGRLTSVQSSRSGWTAYQYDRVDQLIESRRGATREVFEYDPAGSLTRILRDSEQAAPTPAWSLAPGNQLRATANASFVNDGRGRRIQLREGRDPRGANGGAQRGERRITTYGWDAKDQLREVVLPSGARVRFTYDAFGRRVRKDVLPAPSHLSLDGLEISSERPVPGASERYSVEFLWDGNVLCEERDSSKAPNARKRAHVHEPGTFIPLLQAEQGQVFWVMNDHLGMPKELIDEAGRVAWRAEHGAWGNVESVDRERGTSEVQSPFRLLGQYFDEETRLCYVRFRYFCAEQGRWLSSDPWGIFGGLNLQAFDGAPTSVVDPWGLSVEMDPKAINFSQRSVNRRFDTPDGKVPIEKAIRAGPEQVKSFPPIQVQMVKGQPVARDGNSRLLVAQSTDAPTIRVNIETGTEASKALAQRTAQNGLPMSGTPEQPTPR